MAGDIVPPLYAVLPRVFGRFPTPVPTTTKKSKVVPGEWIKKVRWFQGNGPSRGMDCIDCVML